MIWIKEKMIVLVIIERIIVYGEGRLYLNALTRNK